MLNYLANYKIFTRCAMSTFDPRIALYSEGGYECRNKFKKRAIAGGVKWKDVGPYYSRPSLSFQVVSDVSSQILPMRLAG